MESDVAVRIAEARAVLRAMLARVEAGEMLTRNVSISLSRPVRMASMATAAELSQKFWPRFNPTLLRVCADFSCQRATFKSSRWTTVGARSFSRWHKGLRHSWSLRNGLGASAYGA